jgi:hypothetical protein
MTLEIVSRLDMEHPRWGRRKIFVLLSAAGYPMSEATVGRLLAAIRKHCPICDGIERHSEVVHLARVDIRQATSLPLGDPAGHPLKSGIWRRRPAREQMDRELPRGSDEDAQT